MEPYRAFVGISYPMSNSLLDTRCKVCLLVQELPSQTFRCSFSGLVQCPSSRWRRSSTRHSQMGLLFVLFRTFASHRDRFMVDPKNNWKFHPSDEELKEIRERIEAKPHPIIQVFSALIVVLSVPIGLGFGHGYLIPYLFVNYNLLVVITPSLPSFGYSSSTGLLRTIQ